MKTLVITDVQHDFMPGGVLAVAGANEIVPIINRIIPHFEHVVAVRDWHPENHVSFAKRHHRKPGDLIETNGVKQILWPVHCVQNSHGANFANGLHQERIEEVFHKGIDPEVDSYSGFFDNARHRSTGLAEYLEKRKLQNLYFVGVATEYCILYSVLDALELGFNVSVILDCCRAINLEKGDGERATRLMESKGARLLISEDLYG